jgi:hypothetical protein
LSLKKIGMTCGFSITIIDDNLTQRMILARPQRPAPATYRR